MKKIMTKYIVYIFALLVISCDEDILTGKLSKNKGRIEVDYQDQVLRAEDKTPMANIKVTWYANGKTNSTTTNENGYFSVSDIELGEYYFTYSTDGYITSTRKITINPNITTNYSNLKVLGEKNYLYTYTSKTYLYKPMYKFQTQMLIDLGSNYKIPASNMDFSLRIDNLGDIDFGYIEYKGKTDAHGMINLPDSLPDVPFSFTAEKTHGKYTYQFSRTIHPNNVAASYIGNRVLAPSSLYIANTNLVDDLGNEVVSYDSTQAITFTYSEAIDTSRYDLKLFNMETVLELPIKSLVWSNGNKTVSITPEDTLTKNSYSISINQVHSTIGNILPQSVFMFHIGGVNPAAVGQVSNISISGRSGHPTIYWTRGTNIDYYSIEIEIWSNGGTTSNGYRMMISNTASTSYYIHLHNYGSSNPLNQSGNYMNFKFTGYKNGNPITSYVYRVD